MKVYKLIEDVPQVPAPQDQNTMMEIAKETWKFFLDNTGLAVSAAIVEAVVEFFSRQAELLPLSKAEHLVNATNADWRINHFYIEHPRRNQILIPIFDYNDFIKREIVADIANYIMDHFSVKKLVIGIVSKGKAGADAAIPVKNINVDAAISCNLEKDFYVKFENSQKPDIGHEYYWIDCFPEIKAAVEHKSKAFETIKINAVELMASANAAKKIGVKLVSNKKLQLYISYYCD